MNTPMNPDKECMSSNVKARPMRTYLTSSKLYASLD